MMVVTIHITRKMPDEPHRKPSCYLDEVAIVYHVISDFNLI